MDEDVIFLLSITSPMKTDRLEVVFAVDVRKGMLQGLAKLDVRPKNLAIMVTLCTSEICSESGNKMSGPAHIGPTRPTNSNLILALEETRQYATRRLSPRVATPLAAAALLLSGDHARREKRRKKERRERARRVGEGDI
uniref:Uncharacterized protein n=2 Tax=Oryza TaxID=4527 RepID=A0A0E0EHJ1_9ORYZ